MRITDVELTPCEIRLLQYAADGAAYRDIATRLHTTHYAVQKQAQMIFNKLGANNLTHAVAIAQRQKKIL